MDKIKIGIPRALHYYYYGNMWKYFLEELGCEVIISPETTKEIIEIGNKLSNDEMCFSLKIYLGHVSYLESRCDYILIPRIDNYGTNEQTCTNFLCLYDLVQNLFTTKILTYTVDVSHYHDELDGFIKLGKSLKFSKEQSELAYFHSLEKVQKEKKELLNKEKNKLNNSSIKVLIISHPYNFRDDYIGTLLKKILKKQNATWIDAWNFAGEESNKQSLIFSKNLYWKYSKELIGTIQLLKNEIDGILFLTSFPCGIDSLVNELLFRKIDFPYLNLIIDDETGSVGMETRIESFIDILEQKKNVIR